MKEKNFISIVLYMYKNSGEIMRFLPVLDEFLQDNFENYEVIIVDDGTEEHKNKAFKAVIENCSGAVSVLALTKKHGIELAMLAGTDKSVGDYVFEIESGIIDFNISVLMQLFTKAQEGFDVVTGVPKSYRPWGTRLFYWFFNRISDIDINLTTERIFLLSRRAVNSLLNIKEKVRYRKGLLSLIGYNKAMIEYLPSCPKYVDTRSFSEKAALAREIIVSFSSVGSHASLLFAGISILVSIAVSIYALYSSFFLHDAVSGWVSIMGYLSFSFAGVFLISMILSEYIYKIMQETQDRPMYTILEQYSHFSGEKH